MPWTEGAVHPGFCPGRRPRRDEQGAGHVGTELWAREPLVPQVPNHARQG